MLAALAAGRDRGLTKSGLSLLCTFFFCFLCYFLLLATASQIFTAKKKVEGMISISYFLLVSGEKKEIKG